MPRHFAGFDPNTVGIEIARSLSFVVESPNWIWLETSDRLLSLKALELGKDGRCFPALCRRDSCLVNTQAICEQMRLAVAQLTAQA